MEAQYIESKKSKDKRNRRRVHKVASWYNDESEDVLLAQCGEYCHNGWVTIDSLLPFHHKCKKCFSEGYERE